MVQLSGKGETGGSEPGFIQEKRGKDLDRLRVFYLRSKEKTKEGKET